MDSVPLLDVVQALGPLSSGYGERVYTHHNGDLNVGPLSNPPSCDDCLPPMPGSGVRF